jgi:hypothetical protein
LLEERENKPMTSQIKIEAGQKGTDGQIDWTAHAPKQAAPKLTPKTMTKAKRKTSQSMGSERFVIRTDRR